MTSAAAMRFDQRPGVTTEIGGVAHRFFTRLSALT